MPTFSDRQLPSIHYQRIDGQVDRPCLVFLHEGLGCSAAWKDFPERLCRRTGCPGLLFDREGHGRSAAMRAPRGSDYLHRHAREELTTVVATLLPAQPHILVGHSDGGTIALLYAALKPRRLLGAITEAAHVCVEPETLRGIDAAADAFAAGRMAGLAAYHGEKTETLFSAWADTWRSPWFRSWEITALLPGVTTPLLVIQGRQDGYATGAQVDAIVSGVSGPATPLLVDDCGHSPHRDQPEAVLDAMARFIDTLL